jgi:hypothetical protein
MNVFISDELDVGIVAFVVSDLVMLCSEVHVESWSGLIDDNFEMFAGEKESAVLTDDVDDFSCREQDCVGRG